MFAEVHTALKAKQNKKTSAAHYVHWQEGMIDSKAAGEIARSRYWKQPCLHPDKCPLSLNLTLFIPDETKEMILNVVFLAIATLNICIFSPSGWFDFFFFSLKRNKNLMVLCPKVGWRSRLNSTCSASFTQTVFYNFAATKTMTEQSH